MSSAKRQRTAEPSAETPSASTILTVRQPAPEFDSAAVVDGAFANVKLSDYAGKWVVLFFYPLDFTFVCPTEICAFSDRADEFAALNCQLLACSVDSVYAHLKFAQTSRKEGGIAPVKIPLIADIDKQISKDYQVLVNAPDAEKGVTLRGLFLIDPAGILRHITVNDLPVGRDVDEVKRVVQAFQFHDEHGEVCPANWKPGAKTMVDDPEKSKAYFTTLEN